MKGCWRGYKERRDGARVLTGPRDGPGRAVNAKRLGSHEKERSGGARLKSKGSFEWNLDEGEITRRKGEQKRSPREFEPTTLGEEICGISVGNTSPELPISVTWA